MIKFNNTINFVISLALLTSCAGTQKSSEHPKKYELVWADEFEGNSINKENWSFVLWNEGHVNNEWQSYVEDTDNYKVENGILTITATKTGENSLGGYQATRLSSQHKKEFQYGRIEFRAKMPQGRGTWPALWMLGSNHDVVGWPKCGEIDIMEYVGFDPNTTYSNIHTQNDYGDTNNRTAITVKTAEEEFHTYGIIWTKEAINFYVDHPKNIKNTYYPQEKNPDNWAYSQPFYLIMNFAVGGNWGGKQGVDETIWPQSMLVDYVRVYKLIN